MPTASIAELRKKGVRSQSANGQIAYRPLVGLAHSAKSRRRRSISRRTDLVRVAFDTEGDMAGLTTLSETRTASIPSALATASDDIGGLVAHELKTPGAIIRAYAH